MISSKDKSYIGAMLMSVSIFIYVVLFGVFCYMIKATDYYSYVGIAFVADMIWNVILYCICKSYYSRFSDK